MLRFIPKGSVRKSSPIIRKRPYHYGDVQTGKNRDFSPFYIPKRKFFSKNSKFIFSDGKSNTLNLLDLTKLTEESQEEKPKK